VIADRFYPSSKMDWKSKKINKDLKLSNRVIYHEDGTTTDRDLNAAKNLENFYRDSLARINACGDGSSEKEISFSPSAKQESNKKSSFRLL
jgi:transposase